MYFNNSCKICRTEINLYKKQNIKNIEWVDITDNETAEIETQKDAKSLLRRLHIKDGENVIPCPCIICKVIASKPRIWKDIKIFFV